MLRWLQSLSELWIIFKVKNSFAARLWKKHYLLETTSIAVIIQQQKSSESIKPITYFSKSRGKKSIKPRLSALKLYLR